MFIFPERKLPFKNKQGFVTIKLKKGIVLKYFNGTKDNSETVNLKYTSVYLL